MNCREKFELQVFVINADGCLEWTDEVTDNIFRRVVQKRHETGFAGEQGLELRRQPFHQNAMLCDGEGVLAFGLAVPARYARQTMRDVLDLDIQRRGVEQIESATAEHSLPGASWADSPKGKLLKTTISPRQMRVRKPK